MLSLMPGRITAFWLTLKVMVAGAQLCIASGIWPDSKYLIIRSADAVFDERPPPRALDPPPDSTGTALAQHSHLFWPH
jgi:hypothetical protein